MKKVLSLILSVVLLFSTACATEIDLSNLTLAELVELQQRVTMAMWETEEWQEVTVPAGAYEIGKDIPEGYWTITVKEDGFASVKWGSKLNDSKTDIQAADWYQMVQIVPPDAQYKNMISVESVSWDLMAGSYIVIEYDSVVFTPFTGHSLGFK